MNIIWITLESILPANSGGRLGVFKRLEQVSKSERVFLYYPYDDESELQYVGELSKYCVEVHPYSRQKNKVNALRSLFKYPYTVGSRVFEQMKHDIETCLRDNEIDVINIDFPHMCANLLKINTNVPIVLNEHNIEWLVYKTISQSQKNIIKKIAYFFDSLRLKKYEAKILKKVTPKAVTFVSSKDMEYYKANFRSDNCILIPVGADDHKDRTPVLHQGKNIIFVGKMSYGPNVEAMEWFVSSVFPAIIKVIPDVHLYIVGKDPTEEIKEMQSERITVTGMVDSVDGFYDLSDLVVLPLKNGGGVKVKLLEAISYKKLVVSTTTGVEGTEYADGKVYRYVTVLMIL